MSEHAPEIVEEATKYGWVPKEKYHGPEDHWVDADVFAERGRTMLPIVNANKRKLEEDNQRLASTVKELQDKFAASQEAIQALQEFHDEDTARQVKKAKDGLLAELKRAKTEGNVDLEVELTDELSKLNAAAKEEKAKSTQTVEQPAFKPDPVMLKFAEENTWFGQDIRKTNKALGIAQMLRADPELDGITGEDFFDKVLEQMEDGGRRQSKVSEGRPSGGGSGSGAKGYNDLPAEAKEACMKQAKRLVGEGRAHKDLASWQKRYAELYFKE
jgi:hypothetical protein